jgi:hypothetical protein
VSRAMRRSWSPRTNGFSMSPQCMLTPTTSARSRAAETSSIRAAASSGSSSVVMRGAAPGSH